MAMADRRVVSWVLLAAGVAAAAVLVFASWVVPGPALVQAVLYLCLAAVGTAMSVAATRSGPPARRRIWTALAVGQCLYLLGDVLWVLFEHVLHIAPYPSLADAAYLARYVACALGLAWLVRGRRQGRDRAAFLDAAILTTGVAVVAALFLVIPAARSGGETLLSQLVAAAYPVGDLLLLGVLVRLLGSRGPWSASFAGLLAALAVLLASDTYYVLLVVGGSELPHWPDFAYLLTYLLLGFCALHPSSETLTEPLPDREEAVTAWRMAGLGLSSAIAPVLLMVGAARGTQVNAYVVGLGAILGSGLVLVRLFQLLRRAEDQAVQLSVLARSDGLTGIANRRTWDSELARACLQAGERGQPLTVALIDLDDFKRYNDTHGHLTGDLLLKETTAAWAGVLRDEGVLARYGGEEFAVLMPVPPGEAAAVLEGMRAVVTGGQTCSVGVAAWQPGEEPQAAVGRADRALYEAKRSGRDRLVVSAGGVVPCPEPVPAGREPGAVVVPGSRSAPEGLRERPLAR